MDIKKIQEMINETNYWDKRILDIQSNFFGDEINIYIEGNDNSCWKLCFASCYQVAYETDADWRGDIEVRDMKKLQLGYYGHTISVLESELPNFYQVYLQLSIMSITILCKQIDISKIKRVPLQFFREQ